MVEEKHPVADIDYPGTFQEFDEWFNSNDACLDYIAKLRWPTGFCCPNCSEATERPSGDPAHVVMPRVHLVASLLDRWWLGIHQGAIRPVQLEYYLDEFTFRFNRRKSNARGLLFYRLMQQAVNCAPVPRRKIVGG